MTLPYPYLDLTAIPQLSAVYIEPWPSEMEPFKSIIIAGVVEKHRSESQILLDFIRLDVSIGGLFPRAVSELLLTIVINYWPAIF